MSFNYYYIRTDDFSTQAGGGYGATISRDNYEAYFVMYVDDELNAADRSAVEQFLQQNPDLEEELVMLQQSVLRPEEQIIFEQKELLFKIAADLLPINEQNCEEYFVLYGDDELTNEEKDRVEQFVYKHPQYQAEFELIQQVKMVPDKTLTFPDKTYLFRTEEDDSRVIAFPWWRISAAAIALLVIGSLAWYISTQNEHTEVADGESKQTLKTTTPLQVDPETVSPDSQLAYDNGPVIAGTPVDSFAVNEIKKEDLFARSSTNKKNISKESNIQQALYVQHKSDQQPEQDPENIDIAFKAKPVAVAVDNSYERPVVKSVIKRPINEPLAVNTVAEKPEDETDPSPTYVLNTSINKTPLRGFFRKVSRVVDKVTNPEDNGKGGIRIANFEIAVK
jgi:hypothetical protein